MSTIRMYPHTRKKLRMLAVQYDTTMQSYLAQIVDEQYKREVQDGFNLLNPTQDDENEQ